MKRHNQAAGTVYRNIYADCSPEAPPEVVENDQDPVGLPHMDKLVIAN